MLCHEKIALIHVAKNQLHLSDEYYREILAGLSGKTSSKDLDDNEFDKLIKLFKRLGFRQRVRKNVVSKTREIWGCSESQRAKIEALWRTKAREKSNASLQNFIFRIVKKSVAFLTHEDVRKIIKALENIK
jgi:phage gp16-like protein